MMSESDEQSEKLTVRNVSDNNRETNRISSTGIDEFQIDQVRVLPH